MLNYLTERYRRILWNLTLRWPFIPATSPPSSSVLMTSRARCIDKLQSRDFSVISKPAHVGCPRPSNPFSPKPRPFPPSALGTPRFPRNLLLSPLTNVAPEQSRPTGLAEVSAVKIHSGDQTDARGQNCTGQLLWEWAKKLLSFGGGVGVGAQHFCRCHRGGRALLCRLKLRGGKPSKCNCGVWWLFYNLGL